MAFKLTRKEIAEFARINQDGMLFFMWASMDYPAARCCILFGLSTGFRLASESIEKLLKAAICFESGVKPTGSNSLLHNPFLLKEKLKNTRDYGLDKYDDQLKKLNDHYQSRYHDNATSGAGASSDELLQIDEIWLLILESLPIPEESLYKSYLFGQLFDEISLKYYGANHLWLTKENAAFAPKLDGFKKRYDEFEKYYKGLTQ